jgi:malonate decarboxylase epsilon subunit
MNTALLFPGQGSQKPAMLHDLVRHRAVEESLREMSDILGQDVRALDSEEALRSPVAVQLALLAAGVGTARALIESGLEPVAVAGLSVGAFSAAVAAEAISLLDAVQLVRSRAEQMEKLYPTGYGLAAVVGLNEPQTAKLVASVNSKERPVFVANINAPRQIVIAGEIQGMRAVLRLALESGARKAELLPVATLSHCLLLQPVADSLRAQLQSMKVRDPICVYISNVRARAVRTAAGVAKDLADNIAHGVRWHEATSVAQELGCELFLEAVVRKMSIRPYAATSSSQYSWCSPPRTSLILIRQAGGSSCRRIFGDRSGCSGEFGIPGPKLEWGRPLL